MFLHYKNEYMVVKEKNRGRLYLPNDITFSYATKMVLRITL